MEQSEQKLKVLARISEYEKAGRFNDDVEDDPPTIIIRPKDVDYVIKNCRVKF